jgi:hypothetical protein
MRRVCSLADLRHIADMEVNEAPEGFHASDTRGDRILSIKEND